MKYFVYILECRDKSFYIGCTNNLNKRIGEHNNSKRGAHYTKLRRPVKIKYSEEYETIAKARKREAELKRWRRSRKLELVKKSLDSKVSGVKF
jgi:putative endonuclease